jgi:hypothetical protein
MRAFSLLLALTFAVAGALAAETRRVLIRGQGHDSFYIFAP